MILTYHEAIELMSYLPVALPAAGRVIPKQNIDQSEMGHLHQSISDLESLAQGDDIGFDASHMEQPLRRTA
ncbi:hypothetical protein C8P68_106356 [Mucilaginibacter yixingensis]|uniref:Uncharacterized protein n=1 Tax=Mucilaginibacter yixingensis TaxID=1295612 RepID=A0A2T5J7T7_9SPHI|nr:hypothetical protein [Mucilaginibacter yixingensis]PTQ95141.1 hypothetical protein C8P68_106356 [Mucilaginibacter yixingensis]